MSGECEITCAPVQPTVDVDSVKETDNIEIACDSGLETLQVCSASSDTPSDLPLMAKNGRESDENRSVDNVNGSSNSDTISSPRSLSPEDHDSGSSHDHHSDKTDQKNVCETSEIHILSKTACANKLTSQISAKLTGCVSENGANIKCNESSPEGTDQTLNFVKDNEFVESPSKALKSSSISLNEELNEEETNKSTLNRLMFSKSAENVSSTVQNGQDAATNSSQSSLNTEKILSDFTNQKTKVSATQKMLPDSAPGNLDVRYPRLPKELLNQDLGSIYKNVHGIFSTVSGSLKHAYNISHRTSTPKPVSKPVLNTKIINNIFEEDPTIIKENGIEKFEITHEHSPNTEQTVVETDVDPKKDVCRLQVEALEQLLAEQRKEMAVLRERVRQQSDELQQKDETFKEFEGKMDLMRRSVEQAQREKDAAVMRYASSECHVISWQRAAEAAAARERAAHAELELLSGKLRSAHAERQRICQMYDDKCHELLNSERELGRSREECKELEGRLKWTQNRLRTELEAYKSSAERAESLQQRVTELETARDSAAANAADSVRAKHLESEVRELQASLILSRHEKDELEKRVTSLSHQLVTCERERDDAIAALARTTAQVQQLQTRNVSLEEEAASLAGLGARAALADTLSAELDRERERASSAEAALARAAAQRDTCIARESAALQHVAALTQRHSSAAAAATATRQEAAALQADNSALRTRATALEAELGESRAALATEAERRHRENRMLARKVAELTEELTEANKKLEWEKGENGVLKKKHANAIKEINRELQRSLKRCEQLETKIPHTEDRDMRAGSVSSVSSAESAAPTDKDERLQNGVADALPDIHVRSADRQALIERIVSLQRAAARRAERCDFLEEHAKQLTDELRSKSRALRHLLCSTPAGALAGGDSDQHKRDIARLGGGAMAAVWGGDAAGMTLELSLEMNRRLQAVLEDTLLKNITLKENMDTLGKEISKLKAQTGANTECK